MTKLAIKYRAIEDLKKWERNPRSHSDHQVAQLVASIQEFGFTNPVLVDEDLRIIAGHGRAEAAALAGLEEVPTIQIAGLTETQKRAYVIADNKLTLNGGWNIDNLRAEVMALGADFDMDLLGFSENEMQKMLGTESGDGGGGGGLGNPIIKYEIIFDDEEQQERWFAFLRHLKAAHPQIESIGARIHEHLGEYAELTQDREPGADDGAV